jgi:hypothetical protein
MLSQCSRPDANLVLWQRHPSARKTQIKKKMKTRIWIAHAFRCFWVRVGQHFANGLQYHTIYWNIFSCFWNDQGYPFDNTLNILKKNTPYKCSSINPKWIYEWDIFCKFIFLIFNHTYIYITHIQIISGSRFFLLILYFSRQK